MSTKVETKAVAIAVKNVSGRWRWSRLEEWLGSGAYRRRRTMRATGRLA